MHVRTVALIALITIALPLHADTRLIIEYAPWGNVSADKDDETCCELFEHSYEHFEMEFQNSYALKLIHNGLYISTRHHRSHLNEDTNNRINATLSTVTVGIGGYDISIPHNTLAPYIGGGVGIGMGWFDFAPDARGGINKEAFAEAFLEAGIEILEQYTLGAGVTFQGFGYPGETRGYVFDLHLSLGYKF